MNGRKTYLCGLAMLGLAVIMAIRGEYDSAAQMALTAGGLMSLRHAVAKKSRGGA